MYRMVSISTMAILLVSALTAWSAPVTIFEPPGALATELADINNAGQVMRFVADRPPSSAGDSFLRYPDGSFVTILNHSTAAFETLTTLDKSFVPWAVKVSSALRLPLPASIL